MLRTTAFVCALGLACTPSSGPSTAETTTPALTCDADTCNRQGMAALTRVRTAEALALLERACALDHALGCSNLAGLLRTPAVGTADPQRIIALYQRACTLKFADACASVAAIYAEGKLVPADLGKARHEYEQACEQKHANSCHAAASLHSEGRGGPRDPAIALQFFDQACTLGHATSCFNAGSLLFRERGAQPGANERATGYFRSACTAKQAGGCIRLGIATLGGHGVASDREAAKTLFATACELGDSDGCAAAKQLAAAPARGTPTIALTSSLPAITIDGLRVRDLVCRMPEVGPMALAEVVEALAVHKSALNACAPTGATPTVAWTWKKGRASEVSVEGGGSKLETCVRKAVERSRASLTGTCSATLLLGDHRSAAV